MYIDATPAEFKIQDITLVTMITMNWMDTMNNMDYNSYKRSPQANMKAGWFGRRARRMAEPREAPSPAATPPRSPHGNVDTQAQGVNLPRVRKRKVREGTEEHKKHEDQ